MNLYLRLLWLWLVTRGQPVGHGLAPSRLRLWVWPNDLDLFAHVNNGRYLTLMDLGRLHVIRQAGLLRVMRERGWHAAAAAAEIRFRRPLKLWQRVDLVTEVVDWDEAWFVFEQRFESAGKVCARALVKAQFRHRREGVSSATVLKIAGIPGEPAPAGGRLVADLAANVAYDK